MLYYIALPIIMAVHACIATDYNYYVKCDAELVVISGKILSG